MVIKVVEQINDDELIENAWKMYEESFRGLNALAVQRHLMYRHEFDEVMRDPRVQKYLSLDDEGTMCGLSTYTNDLDAMPLISPDYFARRWPDHYAQRRIWYLGFIAIRPDSRGGAVRSLLVDRLWQPVRADRGVAALDICARNDALGLPGTIQRALERLSPDVVTMRLDEQVYWAYELPAVS
jgi:hypothetical protein